MEETKKETLLLNRDNGYDRISAAERAEMNTYCEGYKNYLDKGRTERECVTETVAMAEARGYRPLVRGEALKPGDKVYRVISNKSILLAVIGQQSMEKGAVIGGAHIDCPRLDLKPTPLYEDSELALAKTHYYGGIRKYHWVSIPLALHGVVCKADGSTVTVRIGDEPGDPVLTIPDLLPHLADKQSKEPLWQAIKGEDLNIILGSCPVPEKDEKDRVKQMVLNLLNEKYGITEADLISAELCAVPAYTPADVGLDRSLIGGYGQDDRVCGYAVLKALFDSEDTLQRTGICILTDKEEIGSYGLTGMDSAYFDIFLSDLCRAQGADLNTCIENSFCLSVDVTAAYDPNFAYVYDTRNAARLNKGVGLCKYTGSRGKSGASDAPAEVVAYARRVLDAEGVVWQICELGKVDEGGGGTIAHYMTRRGIPTLDAGTPLLAMHSPFEVSSKLDCYMTYRAMRAFYND
ncbi:MAG: aminopeptidase [Clostridiales bacterium]|nr:aminopeptidase [Clostridiales bacterium]